MIIIIILIYYLLFFVDIISILLNIPLLSRSVYPCYLIQDSEP